MITLHAEQLATQLQRMATLHSCYLLFGKDPLLLQESQDCIINEARAQAFNEHFSTTMDTTTDWSAIFNLCQERSLFASRKTLLLILPDSGINANIEKKILHLLSLLHDDMMLILRISKLSYVMEKSSWFKALSQSAILVNCVTPEPEQLFHWIVRRAKRMKLMLDDSACQLLCNYYEGNLLALVQTLERLSILYPDVPLTISRVESAVNDVAQFMPFQWINAVLAGKSKRSAHILRQLQLEDIEPVVLLRGIQREILLLLTLKRQVTVDPLCVLFDRYKIWQNRRLLLTQAIERLTLAQLRNAVALMTKIELALKQNFSYYHIWSDLNALELLLCGNELPATIFYV